MATLFKEIEIAAEPDVIWAAAKDVGALHTRLVPGFVIDTKLVSPNTNAINPSRDVTFANGLVVREHILSIDDARRRMSWTIESAQVTHYNAVLEIERTTTSGKSRVKWTTDLRPDEAAPQIGAMHDEGLAAMKRAFEARSG